MTTTTTSTTSMSDITGPESLALRVAIYKAEARFADLKHRLDKRELKEQRRLRKARERVEKKVGWKRSVNRGGRTAQVNTGAKALTGLRNGTANDYGSDDVLLRVDNTGYVVNHAGLRITRGAVKVERKRMRSDKPVVDGSDDEGDAAGYFFDNGNNDNDGDA